MRHLAVFAALAFGATGAESAPTGFRPGAAVAAAPVEKAQYYEGGRRMCWYPNNIDGPGWRPCGYNWRRDAGPRGNPPSAVQRGGRGPVTPPTWAGRQWGPGYGVPPQSGAPTRRGPSGQPVRPGARPGQTQLPPGWIAPPGQSFSGPQNRPYTMSPSPLQKRPGQM
ncbi:hypothetical protein [Methylocella sp.]|uniref:hypothetical protein n=1 Tax=Methylocella sp. TaxID=1978226 RepID=UPI00378527FC